MDRRSLFRRLAYGLLASAAVAPGLWATFSDNVPYPFDDDTGPQLDPDLSQGVILPDLTKRPPEGSDGAHATFDEAKIRQAMIAKARASFDFAVKNNFIEPLLKACELTNIPPITMMCVSCFESDMGKNMSVKTTAREDDQQSAHGIAQITLRAFAYLMAKYNAPLRKALSDNQNYSADDDTQAALHAMQFISFDAQNGKPILDLTAYAQVLRPPHKPKNKKQKIVPAKVEPKDEEKLLIQLGRARSNVFLSLFVVGSDLANSVPYVRGDIPDDAIGVKYRLDNWLGLKRTNAVLDACRTKPSTTMIEAFGRTDAKAGDQKMNIFGDNHILPQMRVDDFMKLNLLQYRTVQQTIAACYAAYVPPPKLQTQPLPEIAAKHPSEKGGAKRSRRDMLHLTRR